MQKTFLKFMVFELVERVARFRLLLNECSDALHETAPALKTALLNEATQLENDVLSHKSQLNRLFSESGAGSKQPASGLETMVETLYERLGQLSKALLQLRQLHIEPETYLFLKDALPAELTRDAGEQSVFLAAESEIKAPQAVALPGVLVDALSVLQKNNPLAWVSLTHAYSRHLLDNTSLLEALKLDLRKADKRRAKDATVLSEAHVDALIAHALNLRLLGPAYYFQALSEALLAKDEAFLHLVEPALFYGLNHQNFTHKSLVILHEACERSKSAESTYGPALSEDALAALYRAVEKAIPNRAAFQEKHMERAIQLQERLNQGILLSSTAMYPVSEVDELLNKKRDREDFSIYEPLGMMTEYPHTPREIINAGWLHKMERGPVWLYSTLNEEDGEGFTRILELLDYQDHLLRKSIEVSEVHRVLLCNA